ncbi:MAG: hypothetical protein QNK40_11105 [Desulfobacterales bacterium]|nr:hypothetical protein [Desulfobacterales bacterium]
MNIQKKIKKLVVSVVMFVLGRAFQTASRLDRVIQDEISKWEEGVVIKMQVLSNGPAMCIKKKDDRIRYLVFGAKTADLTVSFKNIEATFTVMSGGWGPSRAWPRIG